MRKMHVLRFAAMSLAAGLCLAGSALAQPSPDGLWEFDDAGNLVAATAGNDLELVGSHSPAAGIAAGDGAVTVPVGSHYIMRHGIEANGGGDFVNQFTLVYDIKIPELGLWYAFYQTNAGNTNDGDAFISPSGGIGVGDTGYSADGTVEVGVWYRLVIVGDLTGPGVDYYLNGTLIHDGGGEGVDGRFSWYTVTHTDNPWVLIFADESGEDAELDVSTVMVYGTPLSAADVAALGGPLGQAASATDGWEVYE